MNQAVENLKKDIVDIHNILFPGNQIESFDLNLIGKDESGSENTTLTSFAFRLQGFLEAESTPEDLECIQTEIDAFKKASVKQ
jgi:hypothetical protein